MTILAADRMRQLAHQLEADQAEVRVELTEFTSGGAMLDVRSADDRAFVMAYSPTAGFGIDELRPNEGFGTGYRFVEHEFERASEQFQRLLSHPVEEAASPVSLNLVVVYASDVDAAIQFYGCLGLKFQSEQHGSGPKHYAATMGDAVLEIYPVANGGGHGIVRLGFHVASVGDVLNELRSQGAKVVSEPKNSPWGLRAVVEDPDGNRVELSQPAPRLTSA